MQLLTSYFLQAGFTDEEARQIAKSFSIMNLNKGECFVEEGKTSKHLGFIEKGFFQYFINLDGEEKTTYSLGANNFIASLISFLNKYRQEKIYVLLRIPQSGL